MSTPPEPYRPPADAHDLFVEQRETNRRLEELLAELRQSAPSDRDEGYRWGGFSLLLALTIVAFVRGTDTATICSAIFFCAALLLLRR